MHLVCVLCQYAPPISILNLWWQWVCNKKENMSKRSLQSSELCARISRECAMCGAIQRNDMQQITFVEELSNVYVPYMQCTSTIPIYVSCVFMNKTLDKHYRKQRKQTVWSVACVRVHRRQQTRCFSAFTLHILQFRLNQWVCITYLRYKCGFLF